MKNYGKSTASEFLDDRIVYRNLVPADERILPLQAIHSQLGMPAGHIPRKVDLDYARAIIHFLEQARRLDGVDGPMQRLVLIGDTRLLDGTAFSNLCQVGGWPGLAFIGSETNQPAEVQIVPGQDNTALYLANRWSSLADFDRYCADLGRPIDQTTTVVIDLDKTILGARGRNAGPIDQARLQAVEETVADLLGSDYDPRAFHRSYDQLNQPEFHPFTADNQDYLAYICLMIGSGLFTLEPLIANVRDGTLSAFHQFITLADQQVLQLPTALRKVHAEIYANVQSGDPTPFKSFRRNEFLTTTRRMGYLPDNAPLQQMLAEEIVITHEVRTWALAWRQRGALLFGLSDKPDEASTPTPGLRALGYQPIHRTATHVVGE